MNDDAVANPPLPSYSKESCTLWSGSEGQVANANVYLVCFLLFWLIVPVFYALYRLIQTACHNYRLTDQRLHESTGILFRQTDELELYRVKDVSIEEPLLQRLVGCGRVVIVTSDKSTPLVVLNAVSNPHVVADLLRDCVERCRVAKGVREID